MEELKPLLEYITNETKSTIELSNLVKIYDNLVVDTENKLPIPEWAKKVYPDEMLPFVKFAFELFSYNDNLKRLRVGVLLHKITQMFLRKANGTLTPNRKMWIFSGHDTTLMPLLDTFGQPLVMTPYASAIIMELYRKNNKYFVKVINNKC